MNTIGKKYYIIKIAVIIALSVMVILGLTHPSSAIGTQKIDTGEKESNSNHDFVSKDGRTVADFAEPVIEKSEKKMRLEVYSQDVSDTSNLSQNLIFKWVKKYQSITYKATVKYYIDLNLITDKNIEVDNLRKTVTITIPKPQYEINLNYNDFDVSDSSTHTFIPAGDIKLSFDDVQKLDEEAREKIDAKVKQENNMAEAEQAGIEMAEKLYAPVVGDVDKAYTLNVEY